MPVLAAAAVLVALVVVGWLAWSTLVAFVGGHIPLTPFHLTGHDGLRGLAWMLTADPTALGILATAVAAALVARARPTETPPDASPAPPGTPAVRRLAAGGTLVRAAILASHRAVAVRILLVAAFAVLSCLAAAVWMVWTAVIAVVGGTVPLTTWQVGGATGGGIVVRAFVVLLFVLVLAPFAVYLLFLAYSLAVAASAQKLLGQGLEQAAAHGQDMHTPRSWLRIIRWAAFAVGVGAALAWAYTT